MKFLILVCCFSNYEIFFIDRIWIFWWNVIVFRWKNMFLGLIEKWRFIEFWGVYVWICFLVMIILYGFGEIGFEYLFVLVCFYSYSRLWYVIYLIILGKMVLVLKKNWFLCSVFLCYWYYVVLLCVKDVFLDLVFG